MDSADQSDAIECVKRAASARGTPLSLVTTHASLIVMGGDRAFKLKRAVRYPYLDYSTPEKRLAACRTELALNRRTAPSLYLDVHAITRDASGRTALGGDGPLVDAVIEMRRFADSALFDTMAREGALTPALMTELAREIARFHGGATVSVAHGGVAGIAAVLDINERSLGGTDLVPREEAEAFARAFRAGLARHADLLEGRRREGKVRRCHGDLILRNICLLDGRPTLFDCLEFDESLATIDVLYDLAFLLMDLWHRGLRDLANLVLNRYLDARDETDGLPLVPYFMAIRAAVRAHVTAAQAMGAPPEEAPALRAEARAYFDLARSLFETGRPMLLAVGGLSGTGKSTVAALVAPHLAPPPGARVLSTDRIRKHMQGVAAEERLPAAAYRPETSEKVYETLRHEASRALAAGSAAVVDAVFDRPGEREAIEAAAAAAGVPFLGVWLEAPVETLLPRLAARRNDPSDADADVLLAQMRRDCGRIAWHRLDAGAPATQTRDRILEVLSAGLP